jgi:hypothetical protein
MDKEKQRDALFEYIKSQKLLEFQKLQQQQINFQPNSSINPINNNLISTNKNPSSNLLVNIFLSNNLCLNSFLLSIFSQGNK